MIFSGTLPQPLIRGSVFRYRGFSIEAKRGTLSCAYELDGREFTERVMLPAGPRWHTEAARAAARLVFLLAGVSYYKTAAPPVIDFGETALTETELAFLREFYLQGLGEFAYRNALDLTSLRLEDRRTSLRLEARRAPARRPVRRDRGARRGDRAAGRPRRTRDRPAATPLRRARLPQRARAGDRDLVRDRRAGRSARGPGRGGDVQRVVGVHPDTGVCRAPG